jgi:CheY-like chemotaxis protein
MQKDEVTILIVDDDQALGKAMAEALTRTGFKAIHVTKPDEAIAILKLQPIHAAVIDCMLPKMNGRELAKKFRTEVGDALPIILVSGIYKDKSFSRDAMASTGARSFLVKPFELPDFVKEIEGFFKTMVDEPVAPLNALLSRNEISHKERIKAINAIEQVHGFDLPWIYSLLMHPRITGHLNIVTAEGVVSGVGFQKGTIAQVNQEDATSYFGVLLVEHGFIEQADFDQALKESSKAKKIGERLVEANAISPHAIEAVMSDQQGIRLSKTVFDTSVKVNFIEADEVRENASTDKALFSELMNEWMDSKFSLDWLKSFYMPWMRYNLKKGPEFSPHARLFMMPVIQRVPGILDMLLTCESLEMALEKMPDKEDHFFRAVHALVITRTLRFGEQTTKTDFGMQRNRLQKLITTMDGQNHFERLGVSNKAKDPEIKRAYHELAKILHPDKLSPDTPADVRELAKQAFERVATAHSVLSDQKEREAYVMELEKGHAGAILQAEQMTENARTLLSKGDFKKAREVLEEAIRLAPPSSETRVLHMWARLKKPNADKDPQLIQSIREEISKIPPEDRYTQSYLFVKSLILKVTGDIDGAKRSFEHLISMFPDLIDARRELSSLSLAANKSGDLLKGDLKDVVGKLFGKR